MSDGAELGPTIFANSKALWAIAPKCYKLTKCSSFVFLT